MKLIERLAHSLKGLLVDLEQHAARTGSAHRGTRCRVLDQICRFGHLTTHGDDAAGLDTTGFFEVEVEGSVAEVLRHRSQIQNINPLPVRDGGRVAVFHFTDDFQDLLLLVVALFLTVVVLVRHGFEFAGSDLEQHAARTGSAHRGTRCRILDQHLAAVDELDDGDGAAFLDATGVSGLEQLGAIAELLLDASVVEYIDPLPIGNDSRLTDGDSHGQCGHDHGQNPDDTDQPFHAF